MALGQGGPSPVALVVADTLGPRFRAIRCLKLVACNQFWMVSELPTDPRVGDGQSPERLDGHAEAGGYLFRRHQSDDIHD